MGKSALALCMAANLAVRRAAGCAVHARDVEDRGDAATHVLRGEGRVASGSARDGSPGRLAAAHRRLRQADEGADLRGRHRLDHDDGAALQGAAAQVARAEARPDRRRLPPADDLGRNVENRVQEVSQISRASRCSHATSRCRSSRSPSSRAPSSRARTSADPVGPARERVDRAGRRPRLLRLPRRVLQRRGDRSQGVAEIILAKHRNGPTDSIKLSFLKRYAKFADLAA